MRGRSLITGLAALLLAAPGAHAAAGTAFVGTATEGDYDIREDFTYEVRFLGYSGAPGTASNLTVRFRANGRATVTDPRGVRAGKGCRRASRTRAECHVRGRRPAHQAGAVFRLRDRDDVVRLRGYPRGGTADVEGGPGNDRVEGSIGSDSLSGGSGDDRLDGGRGFDSLFGGFGPDGADTLAGGPGVDELSYASRMSPLHLDVEGDADDGAAGEGDRIAPDIEFLTGGWKDDELVGDAGGNGLDGGYGGADVLRAGEGKDLLRVSGPGGVLDGGAGDDVLSAQAEAAFDGGPGRDVLYDAATAGASAMALRDGEPDELLCTGEGDNASADAVDLVVGCGKLERDGVPGPRVAFGFGRYGSPRMSTARTVAWDPAAKRLRVMVGCSQDMTAACAVRLTLSSGRRVLFDRSRSVAAGSLRELGAPLSRPARRALANRSLTLRLTGVDRSGAPVLLEERGVRIEDDYGY